MGKNSLLKPTTKKEKPEKKKTKPVDDDKKAAKKAAPRKKSGKAKAVAPAKKAVKKTTKKQAPAKAKPKKPTMKDLIFKKFDAAPPTGIYTPPADPEKANAYSAPPFVSGDKETVDKIRGLLFQKYDMASLKAAAKKAAAEKAAAEKAAAEKAATEKAAAEKAAAEKAAAEKAAAEKAAAEKAAAEKAASEKITSSPMVQKEPEGKVSVSYSGKKEVKSPPDIQDQMLKIAAVFAAVLVFSLLGLCYSHSHTFYLESKNGAVEIWQGKFSPMGKTFLMALPGADLPETMRTQGSKKSIFPFVAGYYLEQADAFPGTTDLIDLAGIQSNLAKAALYAVTPALKKEVAARQTAIDLMTLLYKAEVAAKAETTEGYEAALTLLTRAAALDLDPMQKELVDKKAAAVSAMVMPAGAEDPKVVLEAAPTGDTHGH